MVCSYRKNARHHNPKKDVVRKAVCNKTKRKTKNEMAGWHVHGPEKDGNKWMERQSKGSRGSEVYCKGSQGPPRAVAPLKKKCSSILSQAPLDMGLSGSMVHSGCSSASWRKKFWPYWNINMAGYSLYCTCYGNSLLTHSVTQIYSVILSVLDPRKCEYLKDYSLEFEHAYMTTYLASWEACRYERRCWKCSPPLSRQSWTRRFMFAKVACKTSSLIAAISRRMLFSSSCMVRGLLA